RPAVGHQHHRRTTVMSLDIPTTGYNSAKAKAAPVLALYKELSTTITLPKAVVQAHRQYQQVQDLSPAPNGGQDAIAAAFLAGDPDEANRVAVAVTARKELTTGWQLAIQRASKALRVAITDSADEIHE